MTNSKLKFLTLLILIVGLSFLLTFTCWAQGGMTEVLDSFAQGANYNTAQAQSETALAETIGSIIGKILEIIGIIFLLYMIYGGWIWMKAKGNEEQVTRARNIITNSIIGIVIIMGAYALTFFILRSLGVAVGLTNFGF